MAAVMNPDGSPGVTVRVDVGVSSPALPWLAGELLAACVMAEKLGRGCRHRHPRTPGLGHQVARWPGERALVARVFETGFAVLLKQSHGITRLWPTAGFADHAR